MYMSWNSRAEGMCIIQVHCHTHSYNPLSSTNYCLDCRALNDLAFIPSAFVGPGVHGICGLSRGPPLLSELVTLGAEYSSAACTGRQAEGGRMLSPSTRKNNAKAAAYASASEDEDAAADASKDSQSLAAEHGRVESVFMDNLPNATSFAFSDSGCTIGLQFGSTMPKLLLVGLVERVCLKTVIREIPGITDCFKNEEDGKNGEKIFTMTTNGSNIPGLWQFACRDGDSIIDENGIYSNDIYALLCAYGVEAARAAILREIGGVFAVYKIDVDIRHLELIADYMTFDGGYKPFNRKGISTNPSPLLKASYETTAAFLSDATLHGDFDDLTTPSGNIVMATIAELLPCVVVAKSERYSRGATTPSRPLIQMFDATAPIVYSVQTTLLPARVNTASSIAGNTVPPRNSTPKRRTYSAPSVSPLVTADGGVSVPLPLIGFLVGCIPLSNW
ncbi:hypothetical protein NUW54_g1028 [Trametes sanguinea]|uniref:Uncharacterized protein n=1 Tax=Trametes sanguinea TaxID=158606 RepID=A0ACC1Q7K1_9APHY|nr:hypothetical protein NUW54_g1028 [Trametes sanguinea]